MTDHAGTAASGPPRTRPVAAALNQWFRRPPRIHGEVDHERTVSFLELFYDLVFVVLVSQVAHTLAVHPTWHGLLDFVVVFSLIWIAWLNGSLHHEGHAREDGRGRGNIFGQMSILVVLAVFTAHATTTDGRNFALTYTVLICWIAWQWNTVRRHDVVPRYRRIAGRYILMLVASAALMGVSVFLAQDARFLVWALVVAINAFAPLVDVRHGDDRQLGLMPTESLVERFALLTIIMLGEVVVGVVNGVTETDRSPLVIVTALLALGIGFGFWWNYFDLVGRRVPRATYRAFLPWVFFHLPLTMAIAGSGAGMVGLIAHAADAHTPAGVGWLVAGSSAALLVLIALISTRIEYASAPLRVLVPLMQRRLVAGALACLAVALVMPAPWLFALLVALIHMIFWASLFVSLARHTDHFDTGTGTVTGSVNGTDERVG